MNTAFLTFLISWPVFCVVASAALYRVSRGPWRDLWFGGLIGAFLYLIWWAGAA